MRSQSHKVGLDLPLMSPEAGCRVCPYMLRALQYIVRKANTLPTLKNWVGIRISYGMNGVLLRSADVPSFVSVLRKGVAVKPPDLLWRDWTTSKDRPVVSPRLSA